MKLKIRFLEWLLPFPKEDNIPFQTCPPSRERIENRYVIGLLILWLIVMLFGVARCQAQTQALKIGDKLPDVTVNNVYNFASKAVKLSDFNGKLLIIDFWATWCSPCVAMIPKMDSLQREFNGRVQFLPVSYQQEKDVIPFLQRFGKARTYSFPDVLGDTLLSKLFPHTYLPHYIWVDGAGIIRAITGYEDVNKDTINKMLASQPAALAVKKDDELIKYDQDKPLFFNGNGGDGSTVTYHSTFSTYVKGIPSGFTIDKLDTTKGITITVKNLPPPGIFQVAYMNVAYFGRNRMIFDTKDTAALICPYKGEAAEEWLSQNHGFCYELGVPRAMRSKVFELMQNDLKLLVTDYSAHVEKRKRACLALVRTSKADKIGSAGGETSYHFDGTQGMLRNTSIKILCGELNVIYLHHLPTPVIDETGYTGNVDLDIEANMQNVDELNDALAAYDLKLEPKEREIDVLVITDNKNQP